jgi:enamine deaminase RidA (YjgF/YER057c/UK114 family)
MSRRLISTGSPFEKTAGYSRAVVDGDFAFVAGTTGYDYAKRLAISGRSQPSSSSSGSTSPR